MFPALSFEKCSRDVRSVFKVYLSLVQSVNFRALFRTLNKKLILQENGMFLN